MPRPAPSFKKPAPVPRRPSAPLRPTLYRSGLAPRLGLAAGLAGLVWMAIAWALAA